METALAEVLSSAIMWLASEYTWAFGLFSFIGMLRLVFKPVMSIIENVVIETESKKDDEVLLAVKENKFYKAFAWFVDLFTSIKLKKK